MFHSPLRTRAPRGARRGSRSQGCGRTSAARFFVSGGSVPPTRHPVPTTRHRCRHARSTDSPATRGTTRRSRRPWRGRRAPVGPVRKRAPSAASAATSARGSVSDAAASGCHGTVAGRTRGPPAGEFREGGRLERVTPSATGERHRRPTRAQAGWGDFRSGAHPRKGGGERRWRSGAVEGWPAGAEPEARRNATPCARAERPPRHPLEGQQHSRGP